MHRPPTPPSSDQESDGDTETKLPRLSACKEEDTMLAKVKTRDHNYYWINFNSVPTAAGGVPQLRACQLRDSPAQPLHWSESLSDQTHQGRELQ